MLVLETLENQAQPTFRDVQFSILNTNYVLALTSNARLYVVCLLKDIQLEKSELILDLLPQNPPYKASSETETVDIKCFSQASSADDLGLTPFQLLFLTSSGDIYTLCPLILE